MSTTPEQVGPTITPVKNWRHPRWQQWSNMMQRCGNPRHRDYHSYGGRGITVCERWSGEDGFENFLLDMGERPPSSSLDRINNNEGYSPQNCRWASRQEQQNNMRSNHWIEHDGERHTLAQWARIKGVNYTAFSHLIRCGASVDKAAAIAATRAYKMHLSLREMRKVKFGLL